MFKNEFIAYQKKFKAGLAQKRAKLEQLFFEIEWKQPNKATLYAYLSTVRPLGEIAGFLGYSDVSAPASTLDNLLSENLEDCRLIPPSIVDKIDSLHRSLMDSALQTSKESDNASQNLTLGSNRRKCKKLVTYSLNKESEDALKSYAEEKGYKLVTHQGIDELPAKPDLESCIIAFSIEDRFHSDKGTRSLMTNLSRHYPFSYDIAVGSKNDWTERLAAQRIGAAGFWCQPIAEKELDFTFERLSALSGTDYRVLIIENDPDLNYLYSTLLKEMGMKVEILGTPEKCIEVIQNFRPDLVLIDYYMTHCSGIRVVQVLRQIPELDSLPLVFLTNDRRSSTKKLAMKWGADDFISKSLGYSEFAAAVSHRARRSRKFHSLFYDLQASTKKIEDAAKAKAEFLACMSHEIRTPLNGIIGIADAIKRTNLNSEQRNLIQIINSSSDVLLTLINDVLDFSKLEAGKIEFEYTLFDPIQVITEALKVFESKVAEKNLILSVTYSANFPSQILCDSNKISQVVWNLVSNSIKFTEKGGINVHCSTIDLPEGSTFVLSVRDTGIGMDQESCKRIFEPFVQADSSISRKYGGTGLGISICQGILKAMQGELLVTSEKGLGTVFEASFPLAADALNSVPLLKEHKGGSLRIQAQNPIAKEFFDWCKSHFELNITQARDLKKSPPEDYLDWADPTVSEVLSSEDQTKLQVTVQPGKHLLIPAEILQKLQPPKQQEELGKNLGDQTDWADLKILVVEDNEVNRIVVKKMLGSLGCQIDFAEDGLQGVQACQNKSFDMVLMDCQMPIMDGFESTQAIRRLSRYYEEVPILGISANSSAQVLQKCKDAGMNDYITKPYRLQQLQTTMKRWIASTPEPGSDSDSSPGTFPTPETKTSRRPA